MPPVFVAPPVFVVPPVFVAPPVLPLVPPAAEAPATPSPLPAAAFPPSLEAVAHPPRPNTNKPIQPIPELIRIEQSFRGCGGFELRVSSRGLHHPSALQTRQNVTIQSFR
jgi:hypothetical protein